MSRPKIKNDLLPFRFHTIYRDDLLFKHRPGGGEKQGRTTATGLIPFQLIRNDRTCQKRPFWDSFIYYFHPVFSPPGALKRNQHLLFCPKKTTLFGEILKIFSLISLLRYDSIGSLKRSPRTGLILNCRTDSPASD